MSSANQTVQYYRYSSPSGWSQVPGHVINEAAVDLSVNGQHWLSFACTPAELNALAVGFLFNEGVIQGREEIAAVDVCKQGALVDVWLRRAVKRPAEWQRTSGCTGGVTTAPQITAVDRAAPMARIQPEQLLAAMGQLLQTQVLYRETGGIHSSAISDGQAVRVLAEDIGRHNTLDKLAGKILLDNLVIDPMILITTGRVSSEMLQKSARLGAVAVVSRTSPTSQSVQLAERAGITLVGYARRNGFLVYTHPERIVQEPVE